MNNTPHIRPASHDELIAIHQINQANLPALGSISLEELEHLYRESAYFPVVIREGEILAYMISFAPGADYQSPNYQWFCQRYERFYYVDRIAVTPAGQRQGIASCLYQALSGVARKNKAPLICCEYNIEPPNPESAAFHADCGFEEVGQQQTDSGKKVVSLQALTL